MRPSLCSRGLPAGASLPRRSRLPATAPIWPIRPRRRPGAGASGERRPTTADCDLQLRLLLAGELPESWIPPAQILELRTLVRLRKTLIDQRSAWQQRIHAQLFHQGVPPGLKPRTAAGRRGARRASSCRRPGASSSSSALRMLDQLDRELAPLDRALRAFARRQPGCRALIGQLVRGRRGDARPRSSPSSATARRFTQLRRRRPPQPASTSPSGSPTASARAGHLSHQGPVAVALGAVRSRPVRRPPLLARPRLLPRRSPSGSTTTAPASRSRANSAGAPTTSSANSATTHSRPSTTADEQGDRTLPPNQHHRARVARHHTRCPCGQLPQCSRRQRPRAWPASIDRAAATTRGDNTRSIISSPEHRSAHLDKAGRTAHQHPHRQEVTQPTPTTPAGLNPR